MSQHPVQHPDTNAVKQYLLGLQDRICERLAAVDGKGVFETDAWDRPEGGGGISRVITDGEVFEKGGVNFSHVMGETMPASATAHRPHLAGAPWQAMGVSLVMHPSNPRPTPTSGFLLRPPRMQSRSIGLAGVMTLRPITASTRIASIGTGLRKPLVILSATNCIVSTSTGVTTISTSNTGTSRGAWEGCFLTTTTPGISAVILP